jgi:hypothetical protein
MSKIQTFLKRNKIVSFGGLFHDAPIIGLDVFEDGIWLTGECETGQNVGVHVSCRGDEEIIHGWSELGWVLFGRKFVEKLAEEFYHDFPEFPKEIDYTKLPFVKNYITFKA